MIILIYATAPHGNLQQRLKQWYSEGLQRSPADLHLIEGLRYWHSQGSRRCAYRHEHQALGDW